MAANKKVALTKKTITKTGYKIPEGEKNTVALVIRTKGFDPATGDPIGRNTTYKTDIGMWNQNFSKNYASQGFEILEILHLPVGCVAPVLPEKRK